MGVAGFNCCSCSNLKKTVYFDDDDEQQTNNQNLNPRIEENRNCQITTSLIANPVPLKQSGLKFEAQQGFEDDYDSYFKQLQGCSCNKE